MASKIASITFGTVNGVVLLDLPENIAIVKQTVLVTTAWGAGATLLLGVNGDGDRYFQSGDIDLTTIGAYEGTSMWTQSDSKQVRPVIEHNSSATGQAYLVIEYESVEGL